LKQLVLATGIISLLKEENTPENISRLQNIDELLNGIKTFVKENNDDNGLVSLSHFLADVALITNADNEKEEDRDKVTVMTAHSSKGLEFDVVYIVGMEENLFPSQMSGMSEKSIEEERRLFYVALTRARKSVFLSYSAVRFRWGTMTSSTPSRFIKEIDTRYIDFANNKTANVINNSGFTQNQARPRFDFGESTSYSAKPVYQQKLKPLNTSYNQPASPTSFSSNKETPVNYGTIKPGMTVEHLRFGIGKVLAIDDSGDSAKATINFGSFGQKQLILKFAKLQIL